MTPLPAHDRRRAIEAPAWFRLELARRLVADERWPHLTPGQRLVLLVGVMQWADGRGRLWPSEDAWAREVGVTKRQVRIAIRAAEQLELIRSEPHTRANGRRGSNTITLDPRLFEGGTNRPPLRVNREGGMDRPPLHANGRGRGRNESTATQGRNEATATQGGNGSHPPERLNELNDSSSDEEKPQEPPCPTCDGTRIVDAPPDEQGYSQAMRCPDCAPLRGAR